MSTFTPDRRSLLKGGASVLAGAATISADQMLGFAKAWAQTAQWTPEKGAKINLLRWKRFVEAEDVAFMNIMQAFTKATGVEVNVSNESYDDLQPKASVAANTGQGLDMVDRASRSRCARRRARGRGRPDGPCPRASPQARRGELRLDDVAVERFHDVLVRARLQSSADVVGTVFDRAEYDLRRRAAGLGP